MKYCIYCERYVNPIHENSKQISWTALILWVVFTSGMFLLFYLPFRALSVILSGGDRCPICNAKL